MYVYGGNMGIFYIDGYLRVTRVSTVATLVSTVLTWVYKVTWCVVSNIVPRFSMVVTWVYSVISWIYIVVTSSSMH